MFEKASRIKLRFMCKGVCSVEDLWDLRLTELDNIFKALNTQLKAREGESLLGSTRPADMVLDLQIEIVKHIVKTRLAERDAARASAEQAEKKQKILEVIAHKQDAALLDTPLEDLVKMAEEL